MKDCPDNVGSSDKGGSDQREAYNGYMVKESKVDGIVQSEGGGQSELPLNGYQR